VALWLGMSWTVVKEIFKENLRKRLEIGAWENHEAGVDPPRSPHFLFDLNVSCEPRGVGALRGSP